MNAGQINRETKTDRHHSFKNRVRRTAVLLSTTGSVISILTLMLLVFGLFSATAEAHQPAAPYALIDCQVTLMTVASENDLNGAIACYNATATGAYQISLTQDITLTAATTPISHTGQATLEIIGNQHTLDGANSYRLLTIEAGDVTLSNITLTHGFDTYGGAIYMNSYGYTFDCESGQCPDAFTGSPAVQLTDTVIVSNTASSGGGIYNFAGSLTIENSQIISNQATSTGDSGGAIYNYFGNNLMISNSILNGNRGVNGAGLFNRHSEAVTIENSQLNNNISTYWGGAIFSNSGQGFTIRQNSFNNNYATYDGAAIYSRFHTTATIEYNDFSQNQVTDEGGAFYLYEVDAYQINHNTFTENEAGTGGAIYLFYGDTIDINHNSFLQNSSTGSAGGIFLLRSDYINLVNNTIEGNVAGTNGGGVHNRLSTEVKLEGNTINNNSALYGGGLYTRGTSDTTVQNSTISHNDATYGGAIYVYEQSTAILQHTTIASNTAPITSAAIHVAANGYSSGTLTMTQSIVAYSSESNCIGPLSDNGENLSSDATCITASSSLSMTDPLLEALANNGGDTSTHALPSNSPAVDQAIGGTVSADQRGIARPQGQAADIGAYELEAAIVEISYEAGAINLDWGTNTEGCTAVVYRSESAYDDYQAITVDLSDTTASDPIADDASYYYYVSVADCDVDITASSAVGIFRFGLENE